MTPSARTQYRDVVAQIAARAHEKLPECAGRIDSAVKLVLAGDVELLAEGTALVASRSKAGTEYHLVNGVCECHDYARAPGNYCAHRLAHGIARRVQELLPPAPVETPADAPVPATVALPEARASVNLHLMIQGQRVQLTPRDHDEQALLTRLEALLARYPQPQAQPSQKPAGPKDGWCAIHNVAMKENEKDGRRWFSHRKPDGDGWCKGRLR